METHFATIVSITLPPSEARGAMNAIELFHHDGRAAGVFACGKCRTVWGAQPQAEQCCAPYHCQTCGVEVPRYNTSCSACFAAEQNRIDRTRFHNAEKVESWDGWIYCEGFGRDGFSQSIGELLEECEDEGKELPEYAWTCTPNAFVEVSIGDIKEQIIDSEFCYEDFDPDDLNGIEELAAAISVFNEANAGVLTYSPNFKKAVLIKDSFANNEQKGGDSLRES